MPAVSKWGGALHCGGICCWAHLLHRFKCCWQHMAATYQDPVNVKHKCWRRLWCCQGRGRAQLGQAVASLLPAT
jgi:hypothetical protein